ncbi:hypothetical protein HYW55_03490 [Candidatus Gottesmanbacteria bacterium]|nr:hypothetical protein [Candidatus Gottesmanbacteria bacterium]
MSRNIPKIVFLLFSILTSFYLFRSSFTAYFFQDDWFTIKISKVETLQEIWSFFIPRKDVIYYRPLGMQMPFFINRILFRQDSLWFHVVMFFTFLLNVFLVYVVLNQFIKSKLLSAIGSFFYSTSTLHFILFYWMATYSFVLGTTFYLLAFILFIRFTRGNRRCYWLSLGLFILGLLTNEMIITLPVVLFIFLIFYKGKKFVTWIIPYGAIGFVWFSARFIFFPIPAHGNYSIRAGFHLFSNLKTYLLWSFNWSEVLTEQMVHLFAFNYQLDAYPFVVSVTMVCFIAFMILLFLLPFILGIFNRKKQKLRLFIFCLLGYVISLSPVLFFTQHKFPYYLTISQIFWILGIISIIESTVKRKSTKNLFISIIAFLWILQAATTIEFNTKIHWAPRRADISREFITHAKERYERKPPDVIFIPDSSENRLALNDQDAFQVVFDNRRIETIYVLYDKRIQD